MKKNKILYFLLILIISACAKTATSTSGSKYEEDLQAYRPKYETNKPSKPTTDKPSVSAPTTVPTEHNNKEVDEKLSQIREKNKSIKYTQGYRIQVYSGSNQEAAEKAKEGIYRLYPNLDPEVIYFPPNFKVKVGNYYDRVEAYETLLTLKETFPQALLLPEKVTIK